MDNSDNRKGALILTHLQQEGSCTLGKLLIQRGMRTRTMNIPRTDTSSIEALRPDLLVVMGGPVGVYQADDYPFLKDEITIIQKRLEAGLPTIGVCLGAQIMATALGAEVRCGEQGKEVGWQPLTITEQGKDSPAKHLSGDATNMFHWHGDTFDLPDEATLLASTDQYENQVYGVGKHGLGLQCHPEVCEDQLQEWFVVFQGDVTGENPLVPVHELRAQTARYIETLNKQATLFFDEWLNEAGL